MFVEQGYTLIKNNNSYFDLLEDARKLLEDEKKKRSEEFKKYLKKLDNNSLANNSLDDNRFFYFNSILDFEEFLGFVPEEDYQETVKNIDDFIEIYSVAIQYLKRSEIEIELLKNERNISFNVEHYLYVIFIFRSFIYSILNFFKKNISIPRTHILYFN